MTTVRAARSDYDGGQHARAQGFGVSFKPWARMPPLINKSFLVLFFKKERLSSFFLN
jgi:hypothetical protein